MNYRLPMLACFLYAVFFAVVMFVDVLPWMNAMLEATP